MNISILNECFFTKEHLDKLRSFGNLTIYEDTTTEEEAIKRLRDADIAIADCLIAPLNRKVFDSVNNLRFLSLNTTGYDAVDLQAAKEKGIKVANVPGFATDSVAEQAIALMFGVIRKVALGDKAMRKNPFQIDPGKKEEQKFLGFNVRGKTLGVVGLGAIGQRVAELGKGLGMNVIGYNRTVKDLADVKMVSLEELLKDSDVISVNLKLTPETEYIIAEKELSLMKPTAIIVNTARGKHIDTKALYEALSSDKIAGAGLDVIEDWVDSNPLLKLDNVVLTPHEGFFTKESLTNLADIIINNVESFVQGQPINLVE